MHHKPCQYVAAQQDACKQHSRKVVLLLAVRLVPLQLLVMVVVMVLPLLLATGTAAAVQTQPLSP